MALSYPFEHLNRITDSCLIITALIVLVSGFGGFIPKTVQHSTVRDVAMLIFTDQR